jgi:Fe-S oxidoreductase
MSARVRHRQGALAEAPDHGHPRPVVRGRKEALAGELSALVPNAVTDDVVWDCVTCGACVEECPVSIEHVDHIVDLRRNLVMVESRLPAETETMLRDVERGSREFDVQLTDKSRIQWMPSPFAKLALDLETARLLRVGCPAFDERARLAISTAKLLRGRARRRDSRPRRSCAAIRQGERSSTSSSPTPSRT